MSEVKWIKINVNMYEDEKLQLIEAMKESNEITNIWTKLLLLAGKRNDDGLIYLTNNIPYTKEMLCTILHHNIKTITLALETLESFGMINIDENNFIKIVNWEKHQNVQAMDRVRDLTRERVARHRAKKNGNVTVTQQKEKEEEEKEIEREEEVEKKIVTHCENVTGQVGVLKESSIKHALNRFGEKYVRYAIDEAIRVGKVRITYINGILNTLEKEGFPVIQNIKGGISNGFRISEPEIFGENKNNRQRKMLI